ncbi:peroxisomal coenzyme A diphosphatase NUDT7 [Protopterus annectens]|uniref:peroxisomal coenzyme A diphosphatase NUDT7 n=1 Tax=Protopterus annectens TaxID=7888 RepID=UPI001CFA1E3F|nr:peroxisomal coenzyme A diphosphatase NUDT7 [Protopterus annectens]XP_043937746.1 peroxisomal coenzyme A diphosphatase NUDT7 [Protopterus annectens]XP_043937747.1 peroxisomal coenzyme A diphosphatase NUDT7 [Protopterus annectens]
MNIKERTKEALRKYDTGTKYSHLPFPKASVLVPIFVKDGKLHLILTVRSMKLQTFKGEVCFPGGKLEPEDQNEIDTAVREAEEEIGLEAKDVDVVCSLVPIISKAGLLVTPVVAFIQETFQPIPNQDEVSDVFSVPLDYFLNPAQHFSHSYELHDGTSSRIHFFTYEDPHNNKSYVIWGMTAYFALIVAVLALGRRPAFVVDFEDGDPLSNCEFILRKHYTSKL